MLADFQYSLGTRYQTVLGTLSSYINQDSADFTTVAGQQYYEYPLGTVGLEDVTITIGNVIYTLQPIYDQKMWDWYNALPIQPTSFPQFYFPRRYDFGIYPKPQDEYEGTINKFARDRNLLVDDYTDMTVSLTLDDATLTGSGTAFTAGMEGYWFTITDTAVHGYGYWFRVLTVTDATHIELSQPWPYASISSKTYRIGQTPLIPEEGHIILPWGTAADYYAGPYGNPELYTRFNNMFWTGDANNNIADLDNKNIRGGLIGLKNRYEDRDRDMVVNRLPQGINPSYMIFSQTISQGP